MKGSQKNYENKNIIQFKFALNKNTDRDLIDWLKSGEVTNFRKLVITLLRREKERTRHE